MPELLPGLSLFYDAFWDLMRSRPPMADGPTPISFTELSAYAGLRGWMPETATDAIYYIRALDDVWLKFRRDKGDWDPNKKSHSLISFEEKKEMIEGKDLTFPNQRKPGKG
jgi:hypothetical protein